MGHVIGIDLGGTTINGGLIEGESLIKQVVRDTEAEIGGATTLNHIKDVIRLLQTSETKGIGIGVPSVVDSERGIVYQVQNIKDWEEVHLKSIIEKEFKIPTFINNDANCFAMGERIYGSGRDFENFVGITLGTGVGGGIIQKGKLLHDNNCGSGEYGEMPYRDGILEDYCGSFFFAKHNTTGYDVMEKKKKNDEKAIQIVDEYSKHLAILVKMIVLSVDPEAIIFGGSISKSFHLFKEEVYNNLADFPFPNSIKKLKILRSELQSAEILGAAALCH